MCTAYEYECSYDDHDDNPARVLHGSAGSRGAQSNNINIADSQASTSSRSLGNQPHIGRVAIDGDSSCANTPGSVAGIFDVHKSRYAGASASMAFPHILGRSLGSDSLPKMPSFAYNFGIRPEEAAGSHQLLGQLISEEHLSFYSEVFFAAMAPIADLIDHAIYKRRCREYYSDSGHTAIAFGAVAAGVAALGSFLSPDRCPQESELVQYAKAILDDPASMRMLSIDHIIAGAFGGFYLRATARPNVAWIATCTTMHLCEAIGLHEEENIQKIASVPGAIALGHDIERLRKVFWISWAGHTMLSYEYDRSPVQFRAVTTEAIASTEGSVSDQFLKIVQMIPSPNSPFFLEPQPATPREELFERIRALDRLQLQPPFLVLTKTDLIFCFYRRVYQLRAGISDEIMHIVIKNGSDAIKSAEQLANQGRLFWNVIGSVFQYACVLLALDTAAASSRIASAFKSLETLANAANTRLTRETLSMAKHLLSLHLAKKRKELAELEAVEKSCLSVEMEQTPPSNSNRQDFDWGVDWDQFLIEPYLSTLGPEAQLW